MQCRHTTSIISKCKSIALIAITSWPFPLSFSRSFDIFRNLGMPGSERRRVSSSLGMGCRFLTTWISSSMPRADWPPEGFCGFGACTCGCMLLVSKMSSPPRVPLRMASRSSSAGAWFLLDSCVAIASGTLYNVVNLTWATSVFGQACALRAIY